ncbi:MAG: T9SS type A sorting domain-containing protein [Flavobacteriaceae bacterium]|nr:T9SS type A sorting domain-containing protein [Flavobacteriaceae bacterium]
MLLKKIFLLFLLLLVQGTFAQETIKTIFYNVFDFPSAPPANKTERLKNVLQIYEPDIFMVCEIENDFGADLILMNSLNFDEVLYERAPFIPNQSGPSEIQQMIYFRSSKFSLETVDVIQTTVRDINRYQLKLKTDDQGTNPLFIDIYVAHLKSSQGTANQQLRLQMVTELINYLNTIDPDSYVIFAGDLNVYTASESAYQFLLDQNNSITFKDPIDEPGSWNNNPNFAFLHTQSTRLSNGGFGGGAGGGLDDRFDFILLSENMFENEELMYVENSYNAFGNNGNCFKNRIDSSDCDGDFGADLRSDLYWISDHLPVVMELQTDRVLSTNTTAYTELIKFPNGNMTSNLLQVNVHPSIQFDVDFNLFNVLGQSILSIPNNGQTDFSIDISTLSKGLYYLTTTTQNNKTFKIIKK